MRLNKEMELLESICDGYHIEREHVPSLLKNLLDSSFESHTTHWIISKNKISASNGHGGVEDESNPRIRVTKGPKSKSKEDLDLTGSPLGCSFELDEDLNDDDNDEFILGGRNGACSEDVYVPMSPQEARKILSKINLQTQNTTLSLPCICCITKGESILALGVYRKDNFTSMFQITYEENKGKNDLITFDKLMSNHRSISSSSIKVETSATSEYNVVGDHEDFSEIKLIFKWTKPKSILESPSLTANVSLYMSVKPGDDKLTTHDSWKELRLLKGFIAGVNNEGMTWRERSEGENDLKNDLIVLLDRVRNLTPRSNQEFTDVSAIVDSGGDIEERIGVITDNTRQDVDFTDLLWSTLYKVESYQELSYSLTVILKTLQTDEIRPFIYTRNETKIAQIVQKIVRGSDEPIPEMSGKLPLDILIEIGLEKLKRDYIHILMTNDLAAKDDIKPLMLKSEDKIVECRNLLRLHYILELVVLAQTFLSLNHEDLRAIVSQALKFLISNSSISWREEHFSIHLQSSHFRNQLLQMNPYAWQCKLKSSDGKETTSRFSIDPPMSFITPSVTSHSKDISDSEFSYFTSILSVITRAT